MKRNFVRFTDRKTNEDIIVNLSLISMVDLDSEKLYMNGGKIYFTFKSKQILPDIAEALRNV